MPCVAPHAGSSGARSSYHHAAGGRSCRVGIQKIASRAQQKHVAAKLGRPSTQPVRSEPAQALHHSFSTSVAGQPVNYFADIYVNIHLFLTVSHPFRCTGLATLHTDICTPLPHIHSFKSPCSCNNSRALVHDMSVLLHTNLLDLIGAPGQEAALRAGALLRPVVWLLHVHALRRRRGRVPLHTVRDSMLAPVRSAPPRHQLRRCLST